MKRRGRPEPFGLKSSCGSAQSVSRFGAAGLARITRIDVFGKLKLTKCAPGGKPRRGFFMSAIRRPARLWVHKPGSGTVPSARVWNGPGSAAHHEDVLRCARDTYETRIRATALNCPTPSRPLVIFLLITSLTSDPERRRQASSPERSRQWSHETLHAAQG
jgi:hypothetical protein